MLNLTTTLVTDRVRAIVRAADDGALALATNLENELAADFVRHVAETSVHFATSKECLKHAVRNKAMARMIQETYDHPFERYLADEELDEMEQDDEADNTPSGGPLDDDEA